MRTESHRGLKSLREILDENIEKFKQVWTPPNCPNCMKNDEVIMNVDIDFGDFFCNRCNGAF